MRRKNHYERNYTNHKNRSKDSRLLRRIIVKPKKVTRRAQAYGLILAMLCMIFANPATVLADNVSVPSSGSASQEVTATFSIVHYQTLDTVSSQVFRYPCRCPLIRQRRYFPTVPPCTVQECFRQARRCLLR